MSVIYVARALGKIPYSRTCSVMTSFKILREISRTHVHQGLFDFSMKLSKIQIRQVIVVGGKLLVFNDYCANHF